MHASLASIVTRLGAVAAIAAAALAAGPARALPLISEVFYDAAGSDNGQSFIEIYGESGTPLDGLVLEGVNGANGSIGPVVTLFGVIPCDGIFVVADDLGDGTTLVPNADWIANFDFQNGPDSIVLRDDIEVLDAVGYGEFGPEEVFAGEGLPAPDAPAGSSIGRVFADLDTDDNFADFVVFDAPTPGSAELVVPEPATGVLLVSALASLYGISAARRR
jgi:hypothetical protein